MQYLIRKKLPDYCFQSTFRECEYLLSIFDFSARLNCNMRKISFLCCNIVFHCFFALICYYCAGFTVRFILYCDTK